MHHVGQAHNVLTLRSHVSLLVAAVVAKAKRVTNSRFFSFPQGPMKMESCKSEPNYTFIGYPSPATGEVPHHHGPPPTPRDWEALPVHFQQPQPVPGSEYAVQSWTSSNFQDPHIKLEDDSDSPASLSSSIEDFQGMTGPLDDQPRQAKRRAVRTGLRVTKSSSCLPLASPQHIRTPLALGSGNRRQRQRSGSVTSVSTSFASHRGNKRRAVGSSVPEHLEEAVLGTDGMLFRAEYDYGRVMTTALSSGAAEVVGGVEFFPDDLAAKMLSKRIAHKLSEKTRRTRLTTAIREIERLLPQVAKDEENKKTGGGDGGDDDMNGLKEGEDGDDNEGTPRARPSSSGPVSKVDVAERAVRYIRDLQKEHNDALQRIREMERLLQSERNLMVADPSLSADQEADMR
jgi:hypothetical protein